MEQAQATFDSYRSNKHMVWVLNNAMFKYQASEGIFQISKCRPPPLHMSLQLRILFKSRFLCTLNTIFCLPGLARWKHAWTQQSGRVRLLLPAAASRACGGYAVGCTQASLADRVYAR